MKRKLGYNVHFPGPKTQGKLRYTNLLLGLRVEQKLSVLWVNVQSYIYAMEKMPLAPRTAGREQKKTSTAYRCRCTVIFAMITPAGILRI